MNRWSAALFALLVASSGVGAAQGRARQRVLFVGNSYTRFNDLPRLVSRIAASDPGGPRLRTERQTEPGWSLRQHWERRRASRRIRHGHFDAVVLQERSLNPLEAREETLEYGRRLSGVARSSGARVILFETWARVAGDPSYDELGVRDPAQMLERVEAVYEELGRILRAPVAPVGRAWLRARAAIPDTRLYRDDGTHPLMAGSYLGACVIYGTLTGRDPRAGTYVPHRLGSSRARRIREVAARALADEATRR